MFCFMHFSHYHHIKKEGEIEVAMTMGAIAITCMDQTIEGKSNFTSRLYMTHKEINK